MFKVSMNELMEVLKDFHTLTGFLIVVFDEERNVVASYPNKMCDFCTEVRKSPVLRKRCKTSDEHGFDRCDKEGRACIYQCHMSITEAISPIQFNDSAVGYLMFGQIRGKNAQTIHQKAKEANREYGLSISNAMIDSMTAANDETVEAALHMMTMCAAYLYSNEIIRKDLGMMADRLKDYVAKNLSKDLSIEAVCKRFYLSRTKLYRLCDELFGMGFSDYVRKQRIKAAKKLLKEGELSIAEISDLTGFHDPNYFVRLFKSREGITPLQYKKSVAR